MKQVKRIISLIVSLGVIATPCLANDSVTARFLAEYAVKLFMAVPVSDYPTEEVVCSSIVQIPFVEIKENCENEQSVVGAICQEIKDSMNEIAKMDCRFKKEGDSLIATFSNISPEIDSFLSEKMTPLLSMGNISYQNSSFVFEIKNLMDSSEIKSSDTVKSNLEENLEKGVILDYLNRCSVVAMDEDFSGEKSCKILLENDFPYSLKEADILVDRESNSFIIKTKGLSSEIIEYIIDKNSWEETPVSLEGKVISVNFKGRF